MTRLAQPGGKLVLQGEAGMIGGKGDAHDRIALGIARGFATGFIARLQAAQLHSSRSQISTSASVELVHHRFAVGRAGGEAQPLGAARHGRVVDRLYVDAVFGEQDVADPLGLDRVADQQRDDVGDVAITGRPASRNLALSIAAASCCASRSSCEALRWRTLASAPATSTGDSEVVKMKPGA